MSAEQEVYSALTAASGVTAFVGDRIYQYVAGQGAKFPFVVLERRNSEQIYTIHDGKVEASKVLLSISTWALSSLEAEAITDQVILALRTTGVSINRFGDYDVDTSAHASVIEFEVWEL